MRHCKWREVVFLLIKTLLVSTGDTRPCQALVDAGQGATLLVHEATFEPDLQCKVRQAARLRHCPS